jgi:RNA polymerase sigma factor (sigma-70 family)
VHNPTPNDAELVERARGGDVEAYGALVRRYQEQALSTAYVVLGDRQEAEDASQEAFVRAFVALNRFRAGAAFRPWLLRIVVNEAHDLYTARQRRAQILSRASGGPGTSSATQSAEAAALSQRRRELLLEALFRLPATDRLVVTCRYFLDLSEREIAEVLGVARGTVKSRLSRALARLEPILRELGPLVLVGPALDHVLEGALQELGRGSLLQPSPDVSQAVLQHIGSGAAAGPGLSRLLRKAQHNAAQIIPVAAGIIVGGVVLLTATRQSASNQPPPAPEPPPGASLAVYGGDLTDADRQELAAYFGSTQTATATISRQELVDTLRAQGMSVSPGDQAISSTRVTCGAPGTGLDVQTHNINRIPAPAYAGGLLTAGLADALVEIAAPASKPVSGETALVGIFKAYPTCSAGQQADPERVRLAYEQLKALTTLAGDGADLTRASAVFLEVLHAVITGGVQDPQAIENALNAAAAQQGVPLADSTRSQLVSVFRELEHLDYGEYAHGYDIQQLGPDRARVVLTRSASVQ